MGLAVASADMMVKDKCVERRELAQDERREMFEKSELATKCIFKVEEKMFQCKKADEIIECKAERELDLLTEEEMEKMPEIPIMGLGMMDKETFYRNSKCAKKDLPIVLGCGKKFASAVGLKVADCKCFEKLSALLEISAKEPFMADVKDMEKKVEMISEVLVMDKAVEKRFLWGGWGWGGLSPYFGWGGWGGYGMGGLGWGWGK